MPNTYVTAANVLSACGSQLYGVLDLEDGDAAYATTDALVDALAFANSLIDSYLAGRYELPLTSVPAALRGHGVAVVFWRLLDSKSYAMAENDRSRYDAAIKYFGDLSNGKARLDVAVDEPIVGGAALVQMGSTTPSTRTQPPAWLETF